MALSACIVCGAHSDAVPCSTLKNAQWGNSGMVVSDCKHVGLHWVWGDGWDLVRASICQISPYFCTNLGVHNFSTPLAMDSFLHAKSRIHATFLSSSTSSNPVTTFFIFSINSSLSLPYISSERESLVSHSPATKIALQTFFYYISWHSVCSRLFLMLPAHSWASFLRMNELDPMNYCCLGYGHMSNTYLAYLHASVGGVNTDEGTWIHAWSNRGIWSLTNFG